MNNSINKPKIEPYKEYPALLTPHIELRDLPMPTPELLMKIDVYLKTGVWL